VDVAVREPLVNISWDGQPLARLAERWETSPDGRELRLYLRRNIKFHDGSNLTPELVAETVRYRSKASGMEGFRFSVVLSVRVDDGVVVIRTEQPEAFLLTDLAESHLSPAGRPLVGTGPFVTESTGETVVVRAFDGYYRGRPDLDRVEYRKYQTQRSAWAALMRDEIDAVHEVSQEAVQFVEAESAVRTHSFLRPYYTVLTFNVKHRILREATVRRALNLAIDRQALIAQAMRGRGEPAKGPVWPNNWAYAAASRSYSYNPEAAKLLLDSAGYRLRREQRPGRMPSRFSFSCLLWAGDPRFERHALVLQKQLYDVGIDMEIVPVFDINSFGTRLGSGDFDAYLSEQTSGRSLGWVYYFWHSPGPNSILTSGYTAADGVLDRLRRAVTDEQTRAAVDDLQRVLYDDPPAVFLAWGQGTRAVRNDIQVPKDSAPDIMGSLWQWRRGLQQSARR
jgi:peptide/nickel transport system substrate-binding protein